MTSRGGRTQRRATGTNPPKPASWVRILPPPRPRRALYVSAILNGLAAPPLILLMLILANAPSVKRKSGWLSNGLMIVALAIMTACAVAYTIGWFVVG